MTRDSPVPSASSQTAQEYIAEQLRLETEARDALPYRFDKCSKPLGPLRQSVFACMTCSPSGENEPAGLCYACSISCHGEHDLVELFCKRDFECDCGTTRLEGKPCTLRGSVTNDEASKGNRYSHNFKGQFCACNEKYDPEVERSVMYQCLGLGTVEEGGCGEDWWHVECLMGLPRSKDSNPPSSFPDDNSFEYLICYKCVEAFPWIKQYAGAKGFLPAVSADGPIVPLSIDPADTAPRDDLPKTPGAPVLPKLEDLPGMPAQLTRPSEPLPAEAGASMPGSSSVDAEQIHVPSTNPHKRRLSSPDEPSKRSKLDDKPLHEWLPQAAPGAVTLFLTSSFRDHICHCAACFPLVAKHKQLLEEEEDYAPPISETDGESGKGTSLLEKGEAALSNMDRVRAIEGVMAYQHLKDKVKEFLRPYAESGEMVGAEDIREYFAKLRGEDGVGVNA
ncbi:hypothetical protein K470DRAFT_260299 [Piedraia hortae CBS 480.64]|uniref:UBR-type domain-containing protein n=1 Tax=Piedraia hortae CBS 480.64 TaxID=1314780 RepID=A0A6A7BRN4_9PEZI|nr:hypothetical protein K470DRAFT_260299 [Piedraia hortae CBS 480.64]